MKRTLCLLLSLLMLMSVAAFPVAAAPAADAEGLRFDANTLYQMSHPFSSTPRTFETWLQIDADAKGSDAPGNILGKIACDQGTGMNDNFCLRILSSGDNFYIRLFWRDTSGSTTNFTGHYIPKGEKVHVAVTTTTSSVSLYINGVLKETKSANVINVYPAALAIGGSFAAGNPNYLRKTQMYSFAMYSDARTAAEIVSDMNGAPDVNDADLLVSYDLTAKGVERLKDASKNGNHLDCVRLDEYSYQSEFYPGNELASEGFRFNWVDSYSNTSALAAAPKTMEVTINLRENSSPNVPRFIFHNGTTSLQMYHMQGDNELGLRYKDPSGSVDCWFAGQLRTGDWVHITIVRDGSNVLFYHNGNYVKTTAKNSSLPTTDPFYLGCNPSAKNNQVLYDGKIGSIAFYSDVRTAAEIKADAAAGAYKTPDTDNLLFAYDLRSTKQEEVIDKVEDLSNNNNDLKVTKKWTPGPVSKGDYAYSFAVIGDPQIVTYNDPELMVDMYRWIAENKEEKNIQYVINLGDNTEKDNQEKEWNYVMEAFRVLDDADIPYIINRGNHDDDYRFNWNLNGNNRWNSGAQNPGCGYKELIGNNFQYVDDYGRVNGYTTGAQPCYENAYYELKVGDVYYLIFALDYGARDDTLNWAGKIIEKYPHHNVIITTHNYLNQDGTLTYNNGGDDRSQTTTGSLVGTLPSIQNKNTYDKDPVEGSRVTADGLDYNDGREIWEKLVSKHDNIVMVLSGHVATNGEDSLVKNVRTRENGTQVVEMMVNPQGVDANVALTGMVAMLYFSEDGTQMEVEWYSTAKNAFYNADENHFTETLPVKTFAHNFVNGVCSCGAAEHPVDASLVGTTISLKGDIGLNFYVKLSEQIASDPSAYARLTMPNGSVKTVFVKNLVPVTVNGSECYLFTAPLAAAEMTQDVALQIVCASGVSNTFRYSVKQYAEYLLANAASNAEYAKAAPLVKAMLNYGTQSQTQFDYESGDPANIKISVDDRVLADLGDLSSHKYSTSGTLPTGVTYYGSALQLRSNTVIRHYFTVQDPSVLPAVSAGWSEWKEHSSGLYYTERADISAAYLDQMQALTVGSWSISYSALSYVYSNAETKDAVLMNTLKALRAYNAAANAYFNA